MLKNLTNSCLFKSAPCSISAVTTPSWPHWVAKCIGPSPSSSPPRLGLFKSQPALIRKIATSSLFSSIALWSSVCSHPSGPGPQPSESAPCRTSTLARSSAPFSKAIQMGGSPVLLAPVSAPAWQRASATPTPPSFTASSSAVSPCGDLAVMSAPCWSKNDVDAWLEPTTACKSKESPDASTTLTSAPLWIICWPRCVKPLHSAKANGVSSLELRRLMSNRVDVSPSLGWKWICSPLLWPL